MKRSRMNLRKVLKKEIPIYIGIYHRQHFKLVREKLADLVIYVATAF